MKTKNVVSNPLLVELIPSELVVGVPSDLSFLVRDSETGEPIENATVIGGGTNLRLFAKTNRDGIARVVVHAESHRAPGSTVWRVIADPGMASISRKEIIATHVGTFRNTTEIDTDWQQKFARNQFASELPNILHVGKSYFFFPTLSLNWIQLAKETNYLLSGEQKGLEIFIDSYVNKLHFTIWWYDFNTEFSLSWNQPDNAAIINAQRVNLPQKILYNKVDVQPPIVQPEGDGIISDPCAGRWNFTISRSDTVSNRSAVFFEAYAYCETPQIASGTVFKVYGAGVDLTHVLDKSEASKKIEVRPTESGELIITAEHHDLFRAIRRHFQVKES